MKRYKFKLEATPIKSNPNRDAVESASVSLSVSAAGETVAIKVAQGCLRGNGLACSYESTLRNPTAAGDGFPDGGVMMHFKMRMKPGVDIENDPRFQEGSFGDVYE